MGLDALSRAIDDLVEDGSGFVEGDALVQLVRELSGLEYVTARASASFEASGDWSESGAASAVTWLAMRSSISPRCARQRLRQGRALPGLTVCAQAWSTGEIGAEHFEVIASRRDGTTATALSRDEEPLTDFARTLSFASFTRAVSYWQQCADPDGTEELAERRRSRRDVTLAPRFDGTFAGRITLDAISGEIVTGELGRIERSLFESDWSEARERLGREPRSGELTRSSAQRRADALVEMATRSASSPAGARRPAPLFSVLIGHPTMRGRICELASRVVVSPGSLLNYLDEALVERVVFAPNARVEVGAMTRLFSGATRRAIELRDLECTHPYCERPAADCEVDHIVPFSLGGLTTEENGRLLCGFHNRLRNEHPPPRQKPTIEARPEPATP